MSTALLALGSRRLSSVLRTRLTAAGYTVVSVQRPLALLTEARRFAWDVTLVDNTALGRDALVVLAGVEAGDRPVIGVGLRDLRVSRSLDLPVDFETLLRALDAVLGRSADGLVLRSGRRVAQANGREVVLTRIEFRLLETLLASRPHEVSVPAALEAIWGVSDGPVTPAPLRNHVRNLRLKLGQIGLANAIRSNRGRGYLLAV